MGQSEIRGAALLLAKKHASLIAEGKPEQAAKTLKKHPVDRAMIGTPNQPGTVKWADKCTYRGVEVPVRH